MWSACATIDNTGDVRHALAGDRTGTIDALVRGFDQDPLFAWMCPDAERRPEFTRRFFEPCFRSGLSHGHTYVLEGDRGAALWGPPDVEFFDDADLGRLTEAIEFGAEDRYPIVGAALIELVELHPTEPHFYLDSLAAHSDHRSQGLGGPLIAPVLEICDRDRTPAYLESSNPRNMSFYARNGFELQNRFDLPDGPPIHTMWREPQS